MAPCKVSPLSSDPGPSMRFRSGKWDVHYKSLTWQSMKHERVNVEVIIVLLDLPPVRSSRILIHGT